jgi:hypothetical protein
VNYEALRASVLLSLGPAFHLALEFGCLPALKNLVLMNLQSRSSTSDKSNPAGNRCSSYAELRLGVNCAQYVFSGGGGTLHAQVYCLSSASLCTCVAHGGAAGTA